MNETQTYIHHQGPPRSVRTFINTVVSAILRSHWHGVRSYKLMLITFTGRKSGKQFTTPVRYVQQGETLQVGIPVEYFWWKNLLGEAAVHVLLRGEMRTGIAEVLPAQ